MQKGFTILEFLVYATILVLVLFAIGSFLLWTVRVHMKAEAMRETRISSERVLERMGREIREAKSIYTPTSVYAEHPGQLSLETSKYALAGDQTSYIDFFLCESRLCLKKEGEIPIALSPAALEITRLVFSQIDSGSVRIELEARRETASERPEFQASVSITTTVSVRSHEE
ncbi:MAG: type II secretion system protein [Candidatus Yanofskybacteria bacterium]|nr:type II secretion system protein [Candidatus Yanofskybacteria bacterium]